MPDAPNPETLIRLAASADLTSLLALEHSAETAAHWSAERYKAALADPSRLCLTLDFSGQICGFLVAHRVDRQWELENLVVAQDKRRQGFGSRLMLDFLEQARKQGAHEVFLEVRESNLPAQSLYRKTGFFQTGRRIRYYRHPLEDAILYTLDFINLQQSSGNPYR
jgi:ribosomal-protein-alanine N-acetyltransferase